MRIVPSAAAALLLSVSTAALFATASPAMASCSITGTITFATDCDDDFGPNATATTDGTLTIDDETFDDPNDGPTSFSRVVLKAGSETGGAINIGVDLTGSTYVDSHNSVGVYLLTKKGNITVDIGEDVIIDAYQSGVFAKADNSSAVAGGTVVVTNFGTITGGAGTGDFGSEGIRVRALQGAGSIYNYGSVTSTTGRGLRIDGGSVAGVSDALILNNGSVDSYLDGAHINANAGSATLQNGDDGVITSRTQRGAVASSKLDSASLTNSGEITSLLAAGALVWGAKDAEAVNSGEINATVLDGDDSNDFLHFGVQIWSQDEGKASLVNEEGGTIVAHDGWAAWLLSTDGDVIVDNAGLLQGKSTAVYVGADKIAEQWNENPVLPDYDGAVGGDLTFTNSGIITADTTTDGSGGMGLITLIGRDLGAVTVTNNLTGLIGAGFATGTDLSILGLSEMSPTELAALDPAASNAALILGVAAQSSSIDNHGTLVGRVLVASPYDTLGVGPTSYTAGTMSNSGVWVTSGTSGYTTSLPGTITNTGSVFTIGETTLAGTFKNSGTVWVNATSTDAADLTFSGNYDASGDAALAFNVGTDAYTDTAPLVSLTGAVTGQTKVELLGLDGWDWKSGVTLDLIDSASATSLGADSFVLDAPAVVGFVQYNLNYDADDYLWSFSTEVSQQSVDEVDGVVQTLGQTFSSVVGTALDRGDELRDIFWAPETTEPTAYAASASRPAEAAFDAITPAGQPKIQVWTKAAGAAGLGDGFDATRQSLTAGADVTFGLNDTQVAVGVFGAMSGSTIGYDVSDSGADLSGQTFGVYGTVTTQSGLFASGVFAVDTTDIDLALSGETAQFNAMTTGARVDVGYRMQVGDIAVEPSLGLQYGRTGFDDFTMSNSTVSIDDANMTTVEARLRLSQTFAHETMDISTFAILTVGDTLADDGTLSLSDLGAVGVVDDSGLYGGVALGVEASSLDGRASGFARADLTTSETGHWGALKLGGSYRF